MPMLEGVITIDPVTAAVVKTGAAGEAMDVLMAGNDLSSLAANPIAKAKALEQLAVMARAIAKLIVHIQTNAVVSSTVAAGQTVATTGTASAQAGTVTSAGSATGTVA